jgi:hypothetical protein
MMRCYLFLRKNLCTFLWVKEVRASIDIAAPQLITDQQLDLQDAVAHKISRVIAQAPSVRNCLVLVRLFEG